MHRLLAIVGLGALLAGCSSPEPAELPLREDFSGSCEWPTRWDGVKRGECDEGAYRFELSEASGFYTAWRELERSSWTVEVEVTADLPEQDPRPDLHGFGVGCWTGVRGSGFIFLVWGDGRVVVFEEGPVRGLVPHFEQTTPLPAFRLPARLRARCSGGGDGATLSFSVNGAEVALPVGSSSGAFDVVGFVSRTAADEATIVFDDLVARAPD